jgi:flavin reductase (DIM6/NTAB) family NADH-FMN oxidoreductase RutF
VITAGDHVILTGAVTDLTTASGRPLVFHRGDYVPLH